MITDLLKYEDGGMLNKNPCKIDMDSYDMREALTALFQYMIAFYFTLIVAFDMFFWDKIHHLFVIILASMFATAIIWLYTKPFIGRVISWFFHIFFGYMAFAISNLIWQGDMIWGTFFFLCATATSMSGDIESRKIVKHVDLFKK